MKKRLLKVFLFIGLLFIGFSSAKAADTFTFSISGAKDVKPGDTFPVTVNVKGPNTVDTLTGYDITVDYDDKKLSLEGVPSNQFIQDGISVGDDESSDKNYQIVALTFRVNDGASAGDTTLKLKLNTVKKNGDVDTTSKANSATVSIRSIGADSSLKSLKIPNAVLSPNFDKNVYDYKATVTDVTSVDIDAKASDQYATVSVTENAGALVKGENDVTVVCRAENGQTSTYTIKVTLNVTPTEEELKAQDTTLKSLSVKGQKIDFNANEKKYYINVDYDTTKITVNATPTNENAEVKITGNSKFVVGKNTVKINVTSEDKTKEDTYQIIVTRSEEEKEVIKTCPDSTSKKEWIIFTVSLLFTFTLGIVLGYFLCKTEIFNKIFKKKKKTEEPVEITTLSDTIDLSDTVKNVSKKEPKVEEEIETIDSEK